MANGGVGVGIGVDFAAPVASQDIVNNGDTFALSHMHTLPLTYAHAYPNAPYTCICIYV